MDIKEEVKKPHKLLKMFSIPIDYQEIDYRLWRMINGKMVELDPTTFEKKQKIHVK